MKHFLFLVLLFATVAHLSFAQTVPAPSTGKAAEKNLLGKTSVSALKQAPFSDWFEKGFQEYTPANDVVVKLAAPEIKRTLSQTTVKIFFGSWCGDSKREVPRFLKLAKTLGWKDEQIELIGVDNGDSTLKRSPSGEERGYDIFRVPTFILLQNGREIQRITEYPVASLERDLLSILKQQPYTPNYFSYSRIHEWLQTGVLADTNVSIAGLAGQLRRTAPVAHEGELNGCGYLLLGRGQIQEAITVFRINTLLFPQSSNCFDSAGEGYERIGNVPHAIQAYTRALELDSKNANALARLIKLKSL